MHLRRVTTVKSTWYMQLSLRQFVQRRELLLAMARNLCTSEFYRRRPEESASDDVKDEMRRAIQLQSILTVNHGIKWRETMMSLISSPQQRPLRGETYVCRRWTSHEAEPSASTSSHLRLRRTLWHVFIVKRSTCAARLIELHSTTAAAAMMQADDCHRSRSCVRHGSRLTPQCSVDDPLPSCRCVSDWLESSGSLSVVVVVGDGRGRVLDWVTRWLDFSDRSAANCQCNIWSDRFQLLHLVLFLILAKRRVSMTVQSS